MTRVELAHETRAHIAELVIAAPPSTPAQIALLCQGLKPFARPVAARGSVQR